MWDRRDERVSAGRLGGVRIDWIWLTPLTPCDYGGVARLMWDM